MNLSFPKGDQGRLRGNPKACATNFFKLSECPCAHTPLCLYKYEGAIAEGAALTQIKVGESIHTSSKGKQTTYPEEVIAIDPSPTDPIAIRDAICAAIGKYVTTEHVYVSIVDGVITIEYIGAKELLEVHFGATVLTIEKHCDVREVCTYQTLASGVIPSVNGTEDLANNPYAYDPADSASNTTTATTLQADLETALTAAGVVYNSVVVTPDPDAEMYLITVLADSEFTGTKLGSKAFECCGCEKEFYTAEAADEKKVAAKVARTRKVKKSSTEESK